MPTKPPPASAPPSLPVVTSTTRPAAVAPVPGRAAGLGTRLIYHARVTRGRVEVLADALGLGDAPAKRVRSQWAAGGPRKGDDAGYEDRMAQAIETVHAQKRRFLLVVVFMPVDPRRLMDVAREVAASYEVDAFDLYARTAGAYGIHDRQRGFSFHKRRY